MKIRIDLHTLERAQERGASEKEIQDVVENGKLLPAKRGRIRKFKVYAFGRIWLGREYPEKRVEVVYVTDENTVITVTVYVFYGKWE